MFDSNRAVWGDEKYEIIENPPHSNHCVSCGQHENRKIIDGLFICDKCVEREIRVYEIE